jgi:hypothetical protein
MYLSVLNSFYLRKHPAAASATHEQMAWKVFRRGSQMRIPRLYPVLPDTMQNTEDPTIYCFALTMGY